MPAPFPRATSIPSVLLVLLGAACGTQEGAGAGDAAQDRSSAEPASGARGGARGTLGTIRANAEGMPAEYGEYSSSLLTVMLFGDGEPSRLQVRFPPEPGQTHAVAFMPRATASDLSQIHFLAEGALEVSELGFPDGEVRLEGTFSGTFRTLDGQGSMPITNGRFQAAGLERLRPVAGR